MLRVDHPDLPKFMDAKLDKTQLTNFNLSIAISDKFMKAVKDNNPNRMYNLSHPGMKTGYDLNAKEIFRKIATNAWQNGEPGVIFIDRVNATHAIDEEVESTNPCGEQPLLPFESCNLGSVNLSKMHRMGSNGKSEVDWDKLITTVQLAVRFLDNVIDANKFPIPQIEEKTKQNRKIGLGVMGLADLFIILGIRYDSAQAVNLSKRLARTIQNAAIEATEKLAEERGTFPNWGGLKAWAKEEWPKARRNATVTTIAPTGTLSIIADTSGGIEPNFEFEMYRNHADKKELYYHPLMQMHIEHGFYKKEAFVTANEVTWMWHVKHQAAWQEWVDNAVSKTINMAPTATIDDVEQAYMMAYDMGCKGLTIYRDGSRDEQVLSKVTEEPKADKPVNVSVTINAMSAEEVKAALDNSRGSMIAAMKQAAATVSAGDRPKKAKGETEEFATGCGTLYITHNFTEAGNPLEVFVNSGVGGGCMSQSVAIGRLASLAFRNAIPKEKVVKAIKGIRCPACTNKGLGIASCPDAIAKMIMEAVPPLTHHNSGINWDTPKTDSLAQLAEDFAACGGIITGNEPAKISTGCIIPKPQADVVKQNVISESNKCPDCGAEIKHGSGCKQCIECGWGKCN